MIGIGFLFVQSLPKWRSQRGGMRERCLLWSCQSKLGIKTLSRQSAHLKKKMFYIYIYVIFFTYYNKSDRMLKLPDLLFVLQRIDDSLLVCVEPDSFTVGDFITVG